MESKNSKISSETDCSVTSTTPSLTQEGHYVRHEEPITSSIPSPANSDIFAEMDSPLKRLRLVLVRTNFPENIGMAARASANFGGAPIFLAEPRRWILEKALITATSQGAPLLESVSITKSVAEAVAPCSFVVGTTARKGGARRELASPHEAAEEIALRLKNGEKCAILFGPEDRGLSNEDLECCTRLSTIPTDPHATSLNLAQSVLLYLYECGKALPDVLNEDSRPCLSRHITADERAILFHAMKEALMDLETIPRDNPEHFFLPIARFFDRSDLRRHEMDIFMGICHRISRLAKIAAADASKRP